MSPYQPRLFGKEVKNLGGKRILATYHITVLDPPPGWRGPARPQIHPDPRLSYPALGPYSIPHSARDPCSPYCPTSLPPDPDEQLVHLTERLAGMSPRTVAVTTFALCGFANLSSIAILLGGLGVLVPEKREVIGRLGIKAVLAASLSNLMSAALAGLMLTF